MEVFELVEAVFNPVSRFVVLEALDALAGGLHGVTALVGNYAWGISLSGRLLPSVAMRIDVQSASGVPRSLVLVRPFLSHSGLCPMGEALEQRTANPTEVH